MVNVYSPASDEVAAKRNTATEREWRRVGGFDFMVILRTE
jgi:hypothetical protein